jgi:hypothetical protein
MVGEKMSIPSHSTAPQKQALQVALPARAEEQSTSQASFLRPINHQLSLSNLPQL